MRTKLSILFWIIQSRPQLFQKNPKNPSGFQEVKRVDRVGKSHGGISTPHVHENGKVRPARIDEI